MRAFNRLLAVAIVIALVGANAAVCAGWSVSPQARMACCTENADCPMKEGHSHGSTSHQMTTQAQADSCCAASENHQSPRTGPALAATISSAVLGAGVVAPIRVPALVLSTRGKTDVPIPLTPTPRHLLLSVFLV